LLRLECLEDRLTPATFGVPWPDAGQLTLSFAPDGTPVVGAVTSQLFEVLDARYGRDAWQTAVLQAFQTWAVHANLNIGWVADGGQPFGSSGAIQGDDRFGDVRLGTYPLAADVLAVSQPFDFAAGTWAGDVLLNPIFFQADSPYDLFTVLLHEAGHVFGLDHDDGDSALQPGYGEARDGISAADIARLRELYGERLPDEWEGQKGNDRLDDAANFPASDGLVRADLTTSADVDWYRLTLPNNLDQVTLRLRTAGLSLLRAEVTIFEVARKNAEPVAIASASVTDPLDPTDLVLDLSGWQANTSYYVRVQAARSDVFGIGAYQLELDTGGVSGKGKKPTGKLPADDKSNETIQTATNLLPRAHRRDDRFDYLYRADLADAADVDVYRFKSPNPSTGAAGSTLTVAVWTGQPGAAPPLVTLYGSDRQPLAAQVVVRAGGSVVLQLPDVPLNEFYYLGVRSADGQALPFTVGIRLG
jgi:hypothetical protein